MKAGVSHSTFILLKNNKAVGISHQSSLELWILIGQKVSIGFLEHVYMNALVLIRYRFRSNGWFTGDSR